jgi:hypothetical protein
MQKAYGHARFAAHRAAIVLTRLPLLARNCHWIAEFAGHGIDRPKMGRYR